MGLPLPRLALHAAREGAERTRHPRARSRRGVAATPPLVSVIVPVRNGGSAVAELLAALAAQTLPPEQFEVVIGDDGSTDEATVGLDTEDGWLRVVAGPPLTSYAARNRAASVARGAVLAFCDVDCRPERDWLRSGLAALNGSRVLLPSTGEGRGAQRADGEQLTVAADSGAVDGAADLVAGLVRLEIPQPPSIWSLLDAQMFLNQEQLVRRGSAVTANLFVRREVFDRVGGFDARAARGGDISFVRACVRAGARLVFSEQAAVRHPARRSARIFLKKFWGMNRAQAARSRERGRSFVKSRSAAGAFLPILGPVWLRWRGGAPVFLERRRLEQSGVRWRRWDAVRTFLMLYLFLPYVAAAAKIWGRVTDRRGGGGKARGVATVAGGRKDADAPAVEPRRDG